MQRLIMQFCSKYLKLVLKSVTTTTVMTMMTTTTTTVTLAIKRCTRGVQTRRDYIYFRSQGRKSRSKVKVKCHRNLLTSREHLLSYINLWLMFFSVCAIRQTDRQTDTPRDAGNTVHRTACRQIVVTGHVI